MVGKFPEPAGIPEIPALTTFSLPSSTISSSGRPGRQSAGAAAHTTGGNTVPGCIFKMIIQPGLDPLQVKRLGCRCCHSWAVYRPVVCKTILPGFKKRLTFLTLALNQKAPPTNGVNIRSAPFGSPGERPTALQKQASYRAGTGQTEMGFWAPAFQKETDPCNPRKRRASSTGTAAASQDAPDQ